MFFLNIPHLPNICPPNKHPIIFSPGIKVKYSLDGAVVLTASYGGVGEFDTYPIRSGGKLYWA
jgi:hypothetical protein